MIGFRIGVRMSDEEQVRLRCEYLKDGWYEAPVYSRLAFVSLDGRLLHAYDVDSGELCALNLGWLEEARTMKVNHE